MTTTNDKIKIVYHISDGYVGHRPQYLKINREEWDEMDDDERDQLVHELVLQNLSYDWKIA